MTDTSPTRLWQIGNCEECGGPLWSNNVDGMTLPVKGQRHPWCQSFDEPWRKQRKAPR